MMMVTGGCCQGKLVFVQSLSGEDASRTAVLRTAALKTGISIADGRQDTYEAAFSARIICHLELYIRRLMEAGDSPSGFVERLIRENPDAAVITDEIGSGVVPADPFEREYREVNGRLCQRIAAASDQVYRVIAGIGIKIKG